MTSESKYNNPILDWDQFPPFDLIKTEHIQPAFDILFEESEAELKTIEAAIPQTYDELIHPLEKITDRIFRSWNIVSHLNGVKNSPELREVYQIVQPKLVAFSNRMNQSEGVYKALCTLRASEAWQTYDSGQQRIIETLIRNAEQSGIGLGGPERERFNQISQRLAELSNQFGNNVLDETKAFKLVLESEEDIAGLPESYLKLAHQAAVREEMPDASAESGPWVVTLDAPSYTPFLKFSARRDLRQHVYKAYYNRATHGERNNIPLVDEIIALRQELSKLLGYSSYAELSLSNKMAGSADRVEQFLADLFKISKPAAASDLEEITELAHANGVEGELAAWDEQYWAEKLRESRFDLNEELVREYFPFEQVMDGMFKLVNRIFDIEVVAADGDVPVWHPDVRHFKVLNEAGVEIARFYLDPYARPEEKRGGAWANPAVGRSKSLAPAGQEVRIPVAYMMCNQTPPLDDIPSLMSIREVETLFHEFGHDLQHMLTTVDHTLCAGLAMIEWDAVEIASQFMENWIYHKPTLRELSGHYKTGEPLPDELLDKIIAARTFRAGYGLSRQINFGLFDLTLHTDDGPENRNILDLQHKIARDVLAIPQENDNYFYCQFSHLFSGGYAAGYYSYKWSEVLCADAFAAFLEVGLDNEEEVKTIGRRYRDTILGLGGSQHPMEVFVSFRGREPSIEPLLKQEGLL